MIRCSKNVIGLHTIICTIHSTIWSFKIADTTIKNIARNKQQVSITCSWGKGKQSYAQFLHKDKPHDSCWSCLILSTQHFSLFTTWVTANCGSLGIHSWALAKPTVPTHGSWNNHKSWWLDDNEYLERHTWINASVPESHCKKKIRQHFFILFSHGIPQVSKQTLTSSLPLCGQAIGDGAVNLSIEKSSNTGVERNC